MNNDIYKNVDYKSSSTNYSDCILDTPLNNREMTFVRNLINKIFWLEDFNDSNIDVLFLKILCAVYFYSPKCGVDGRILRWPWVPLLSINYY